MAQAWSPADLWLLCLVGFEEPVSVAAWGKANTNKGHNTMDPAREDNLKGDGIDCRTHTLGLFEVISFNERCLGFSNPCPGKKGLYGNG